jgi:hypothetical protein
MIDSTNRDQSTRARQHYYFRARLKVIEKLRERQFQM